MTHRNAPLNIEGQRRFIGRRRTRPIAHVAAEMGISRGTAPRTATGARANSASSTDPPHRTIGRPPLPVTCLSGSKTFGGPASGRPHESRSSSPLQEPQSVEELSAGTPLPLD